MEIKELLLTNNDCYKKSEKVKHNKIVVHSTGANNPNLKRYIQPDDGIIGVNKYNNHWNRSGVSKCLHFMIGKDKNGTVRVYQTLPLDYRCWGCGSGKNGSYNDNAIQFEILEDDLTNETYFDKAFRSAIELCSHICKELNITEKDIVSHNEANELGYASNHGDCDHWLAKFDKNMDWFRSEVKKLLDVKTLEVGEKVKLKKGALYTNSKEPKSWVYERVLYVRQLVGTDKAKVSIYETGAITGTVWVKDLVSLEETVQEVVKDTYYPAYRGKSIFLDTILKSVGVPAKYLGGYKNRLPLAEKQGIKNYRGTISQNSTLKKLAKSGKLLKI